MLTQEQQDTLKKVRDVFSIVTENITRKEFIAAYRRVLGLIDKLGTDLNLKIDEKLSNTQSEIEKSVQMVEQVKLDTQILIEKLQDSNEKSLSALKKKALENIDNLFAKLELEDKMETALNGHTDKVEELNTKILSIPTVEEIQSAIIIPEPKTYSAEEVRDMLASLVGEQRLDWTAIKWPDNKITAPTDSNQLGGLVSTRTRFVDDETPTGTIDGVNTVFTIKKSPVAGSVKVYRGGARQRVSEDYTISDRTITFTIPPVVGEIILVDSRY